MVAGLLAHHEHGEHREHDAHDRDPGQRLASHQTHSDRNSAGHHGGERGHHTHRTTRERRVQQPDCESTDQTGSYRVGDQFGRDGAGDHEEGEQGQQHRARWVGDGEDLHRTDAAGGEASHEVGDAPRQARHQREQGTHCYRPPGLPVMAFHDREPFYGRECGG